MSLLLNVNMLSRFVIASLPRSMSEPRVVRNLHYNLSWVAQHSVAYSFTELPKPLRLGG